MLTISALECVRVSVTSNTGTVRFADGATVQLPCQVLSRSSLLHQAVSETDVANDEVSLSLPEGVLALWMDALRAVGVAVREQQHSLLVRSTYMYSNSNSYSLLVRVPCMYANSNSYSPLYMYGLLTTSGRQRRSQTSHATANDCWNTSWYVQYPMS